MSLTFTDIFCGAGGSSSGLDAAGYELKLAANHWDLAIETHAKNFRDADHLCADVSNYDMRRLPKTDVLWASPECTWHSPAGGRRKRRAQLDMFDEYVPSDAEVRSRATMLDVIRATEVHRYAAVLVENVVDVADWDLFDWWLDGMRKLGYVEQIVCASSAHIGGPSNAPAPQWRDRLYVVFTREGVRLPDVEPRPLALCFECSELVLARQAWKRVDRRRIGKYGQQYVYRCPNTKCRHAIVEPFVLPAAAAIDWSDTGTRIGDRKKPLAPATMRRIRRGLELFAQPIAVAAGGNSWERPGSDYVRAWPVDETPLNARACTSGEAIVVTLNHGHKGGDDSRAFRAHEAPFASRTTSIGEGVVLPFQVHGMAGTGEASRDTSQVAPITNPFRTIVKEGRGHHNIVIPEAFITMLRTNATARGISDDALATIATGRHHYLTVPPGAFYLKQYGPKLTDDLACKDVGEPLSSITTKDHHWLVVPYRRGRAKTTGEPLHTLATRDSAALVEPAIDVEDCHFRMLKPREHLRGQRFPDSYEVLGNQGEQTMQAGNAVSSNVAQWLGERLADVL